MKQEIRLVPIDFVPGFEVVQRKWRQDLVGKPKPKVLPSAFQRWINWRKRNA